MDELKRFYRNGLFSFKALFGFVEPKVYLLVKIINPAFQVIFFSLIASHAYGNKNITPWVLGNSFVLCIYNSFFGVGTCLISERAFGTLKLFITAPASKFKVLLGKTTFHILDSLVTVTIGLITGYIFFNLRISPSKLPLFILLLISALFCACAMGLLIGSIGLITKDINLILNLASMMLMALSGVNYPIDKLPLFLQKLSYLMPLTRALKGARSLLANNSSINITSLILGEILLGIFYALAAYMLLKLMEYIAKKNATLSIY